MLDGMADKGLVLDMPLRDGTYYMLTPMVIGFFEFTFMRVREEINMKGLAELFETYMQSPEAEKEFTSSDTKLLKALVYESLIPAAVETEVLDYERASEIIRQSGGGALSLCACRHAASHLGKACNAPNGCLHLSGSRWAMDCAPGDRQTGDGGRTAESAGPDGKAGTRAPWRQCSQTAGQHLPLLQLLLWGPAPYQGTWIVHDAPE